MRILPVQLAEDPSEVTTLGRVPLRGERVMGVSGRRHREGAERECRHAMQSEDLHSSLRRVNSSQQCILARPRTVIPVDACDSLPHSVPGRPV